MDYRKALIPVAAMAFVLASAPASADALLRLTNLGTQITVADGDGTDANSAVGEVAFQGALGGWFSNASTGFATSFPATSSLIDLVSANATSGVTAQGDLVLEFTETNLSYGALAPALTQIDGNIGGTTTGTVTWFLFVDATNAAFGTGQAILSAPNSANTRSFSSSWSGLAALSAPYSMTLRVVISHPDTLRGEVRRSSFNFEGRAVPEPGTLLLLGGALLGLAVLGRKAA